MSTGPLTAEGKRRSRQNAVRHGLTAETVIGALEDSEDYAAFEMAVTSDFDAPSAVERELVLRLASLLWRLRRVTAMEAGLFDIQARQLSRRRDGFQQRQRVIDGMYRNVMAGDDNKRTLREENNDRSTNDKSTTMTDVAHQSDLAQSFLQINKLPVAPLDRLSRYEAALWRQASQVLWTLKCLGRRKPWQPLRSRPL